MNADGSQWGACLLHQFLDEVKRSAELVDVFRDDLRAETTRGIVVQMLTDLV